MFGLFRKRRCSHGIAPGTPATLDAALTHRPPLAVVVREEVMQTNFMRWAPVEWRGQRGWPLMPCAHYERMIESKPHGGGSSSPLDGMTGLFEYDVTYEHVFLRPCGECGHTDPLELNEVLRAAGYKRNALFMPAIVEQAPRETWVRHVVEAPWPRCPRCRDGGPKDTHDICTWCGSAKVDPTPRRGRRRS